MILVAVLLVTGLPCQYYITRYILCTFYDRTWVPSRDDSSELEQEPAVWIKLVTLLTFMAWVTPLIYMTIAPRPVSLLPPSMKTFIMWLIIILIPYLPHICGSLQNCRSLHLWSSMRTSLDGSLLKNVVVGPFIEEMLFRHYLPDLLPNPGSAINVLMASYLFGVAHLHHIADSCLDGTNGPQTLFMGYEYLLQCCYTSVFALYCFLIYLNSKSLLLTIFSHSLSNFYGMPFFYYSCHVEMMTTVPIIVIGLHVMSICYALNFASI